MHLLPSRPSRRTHNFSGDKSTTRAKPLVKINASNRLAQKYRNRKAAGTILSEMRNDVDSYTSDEAIPRKKPTANKHTLPASHQKDKIERPGGGVMAAPEPIPDTGSQPTNIQVLGNQLVSILPASSGYKASMSFPTAWYSAPFTPMPPLMSLVSSVTFSVASVPPLPTLPPSPGPAHSRGAVNASEVRPKPLLSTPVIVLLAVGAGLFLVGVFILIKICSRPTRRPRPTPSLPILQDSFSDSSFHTEKDSPIFGGQERLSSQPGNNGAPWAWTQYPHSGSTLSHSAQAATDGKLRTDNVSGYGSVSLSPRLQGIPSYSGNSRKNQHRFTAHAHTQSAPILSPRNPPSQPSLQQVQSALTHSANRLSSSLYPSRAQSTSTEVGFEFNSLEQGTTFTADEFHVIKRTKSKGTFQRHGNNPHTEEAKGPKYHGLIRGLPYDGADVSSPRLPYTMPELVAPIPSRGGRTRIKSSYYTTGSYPRTSHLPFTSKTGSHRSRFEPLHSLATSGSESREEKDTQASITTLESASLNTEYAMTSPQPSIYPDDSSSVVEARRPHKRTNKKFSSNRTSVADIIEDRPSLPVIPPVMDASAALGSLMLMDFGVTSKSLVTLGVHPDEDFKAQLDVPQNLRETHKVGENLLRVPNTSSKQSIQRSDDKPPHIPLPLPLPSLSQMGLERANPEAYAAYRSPTYSIYGLYEGERKSGFGY